MKTLVPKSCFRRLARDIARKNALNGLKALRFREDAMESLQEAAEAHVCMLLRNANKICAAAGRQTLHKMDLQLANSIIHNTHLNLGDTVVPVEETEDAAEDAVEDVEEDPEEDVEEEDPEVDYDRSDTATDEDEEI